MDFNIILEYIIKNYRSEKIWESTSSYFVDPKTTEKIVRSFFESPKYNTIKTHITTTYNHILEQKSRNEATDKQNAEKKDVQFLNNIIRILFRLRPSTTLGFDLYKFWHSELEALVHYPTDFKFGDLKADMHRMIGKFLCGKLSYVEQGRQCRDLLIIVNILKTGYSDLEYHMILSFDSTPFSGGYYNIEKFVPSLSLAILIILLKKHGNAYEENYKKKIEHYLNSTQGRDVHTLFSAFIIEAVLYILTTANADINISHITKLMEKYEKDGRLHESEKFPAQVSEKLYLTEGLPFAFRSSIKRNVAKKKVVRCKSPLRKSRHNTSHRKSPRRKSPRRKSPRRKVRVSTKKVKSKK